MALAGGVGADLDLGTDFEGAADWFGEDQGRIIVTCDHEQGEALKAAAHESGVAITYLGTTEGDAINVDEGEVSLAALRAAHEGFFPALMSNEL